MAKRAWTIGLLALLAACSDPDVPVQLADATAETAAGDAQIAPPDTADVADVPAIADVADVADVSDVADTPDIPDIPAPPDVPDVADTALPDLPPPDVWTYELPPGPDAWPATCPPLADGPDAAATADGGADAAWITSGGCNPSCPNAPVPVITVLEGDAVVPQTTLHLHGSSSYGVTNCAPDANKPVVKYKWTTSQPAGSAMPFQPSDTFANPIFLPDTAGVYDFCLTVTDATGVSACAPACVHALVVPDNAVHVELLWNTPADPDQNDTGPAAGADMDLHFAHPLAIGPDVDCDGVADPWFNNPFDCFWFNNSPAWGSATSYADDPTLDLDDTDGAGPENLNLTQPEGAAGDPQAYAVGAHYWHDHGFGVSYATVNLYLFGALTLHISGVKMAMWDMWYVGKLNWPNALAGGTAEPFTLCRQTGNPCQPGGKMWDPNGCGLCITPCYVTPNAPLTGVVPPPWCP